MAHKDALHTEIRVYATVLLLGCLLFGASPLFPQTQSSDLKSPSRPAPDPAQKTRVVQNLAKSPLRFEVNEGQSDQRVEFLSRGQGYTLFLAGEEAVLNLAAPRDQKKPKTLNPKTASQNPPASTSTIVRMKLAGARASKAVGVDPLPTKSNYLLGNNPTKWRRNVSNYSKVKYADVYTGIDLVYYGNQRQLEYDFVVAAGSDPRAIRVATAFLEDVLARLPYPVEAVLTDNDLVFTMRFAYYWQRKTYFEQACQSLGIQHRLLRPHRPESNGKVERFIKTIDDECYAVRRPRSSRTRVRVLEEFLWFYNHQRPHLSLQGLTPIQRREKYFLQA